MSYLQVSPVASNRIEPSLRSHLDAESDAMLVVNDNGRIIYANLPAEQLIGYSVSELLGQKVEVLVPPRFRARHVCQRAAFCAENPHVRPMGSGLKLYGVCKDGAEVPVEISLSPIGTPDENETVFIARVKIVPPFWERLESGLEKLLE